MNFPELSCDDVDGIIGRRWRGLYRSIRDLAKETTGLQGAIALPRATTLDGKYMTELRHRCRCLLDKELMGLQVGDWQEQWPKQK